MDFRVRVRTALRRKLLLPGPESRPAKLGYFRPSLTGLIVFLGVYPGLTWAGFRPSLRDLGPVQTEMGGHGLQSSRENGIAWKLLLPGPEGRLAELGYFRPSLTVTQD